MVRLPSVTDSVQPSEFSVHFGVGTCPVELCPSRANADASVSKPWEPKWWLRMGDKAFAFLTSRKLA